MVGKNSKLLFAGYEQCLKDCKLMFAKLSCILDFSYYDCLLKLQLGII